MPSSRLMFVALACALASPASAEGEAPVRLAPHRVVYDLTLDMSRGARTIEGGRGRIAFELTGNPCEGYNLNYRQVTVLESSETGTKMSDLRSTNRESGDGATFRFRNDTRGPGEPSLVEGEAERDGARALTVRLKRPKRDTLEVEGEVVFPNTQMRDLIAAARAGKTTLAERLFDGSDDGRKAYETLAVIGKRIESGAGEDLEEAARQPGLRALARWPVTLSYFNPGRNDAAPAYVLGFEVYENGVSRALRLDYGDFAFRGEMKRLDLLPDRACGK